LARFPALAVAAGSSNRNVAHKAHGSHHHDNHHHDNYHHDNHHHDNHHHDNHRKGKRP
jgi:hypothetical protein